MKEIEVLKTIFKDSPDILNLLNEISKEIEKLTAESTEWESKCYHYQDIINELEKYLNEQVDYMTHLSIERMVAFDCCRHKLQELKGSDKE